MPGFVARAPVRVDLGGGWTDVPPYSEEQGGFVCNFAITRYSTAAVHVADQPDSNSSSSHQAGESALALAALARARTHGDDRNVALQLTSDYPVGAGLGGSSAAGVASVAALLAWRGEYRNRSEIAELSRSIEVEDLGVPGGRQDHYAAAFGGALALTFSDGPVQVERIEPGAGTIGQFLERAVLIYTGQSRISGATISAVLDAYRNRETRVCDALARMRDNARGIAALLARGDIDALADAVAEQWTFQRSLHPGITTPEIENIMSAGKRAGARAGKALGASGGGCVLLIARAGEAEKLRAAVAPLGQILEFGMDMEGVTLQKTEER